MQWLLKQVKIIDSTSEHHNQTKDVLIKDGRIEAIRNSISADAKVVEGQGICVSPGWLDVGAFVGDPGLEHLETLPSLGNTAIRGGYTHVVVLPNTEPALDSKSQIDYIVKQSQSLPVTIMAMGALTIRCEGKEMAELIDMNNAGAVAFGDGKHAVQDAGILLRALEYVKSFDGLVLNHPHVEGVSPDGLIHEGDVSVSLGLRGLPTMTEVLMLRRDIELLRYSGSKLLVHNISCKESIEEVRMAKAEGLNIYCSVPALNLASITEHLRDFDVNYKVLPPIRPVEHQKALLAALRDGTIDFVTSNHTPVDIEGKKLEFVYAQFGVSGLESTYPTLVKAFGKNRAISLIVDKLAIHNRKVLGIPVPTIERGGKADITIFRPGGETNFDGATFASKGKNNPFIGKTLPGKVIGIITKGTLHPS